MWLGEEAPHSLGTRQGSVGREPPASSIPAPFKGCGELSVQGYLLARADDYAVDS